jgi:hypothetical protein
MCFLPRATARCRAWFSPFASLADGVGNTAVRLPAPCEAEPPFPVMRGTHIGRSKAQPFRIVPALGQVSENVPDSCPSVAMRSPDSGHVLQDNDCGFHVANRPEDEIPDLAVLSESPGPLPGETVIDARDACRNDVHQASQAASIEACEIAPNRSGWKAPFFHALCKNAGCGEFPFDVTDRDNSSQGDVDCDVESSDAGAERQGT